MPYYVYILKSDNGIYYKGSTEDYEKRLKEHNSGLSSYTSRESNWKLIYVEELPDKKSMLIRERKLKHCKADYFEWLINQPTNLLNK